MNDDGIKKIEEAFRKYSEQVDAAKAEYEKKIMNIIEEIKKNKIEEIKNSLRS